MTNKGGCTERSTQGIQEKRETKWRERERGRVRERGRERERERERERKREGGKEI